MNTRLKEIRLNVHMNQEDFGSRLGVTKAAISKLENGERNITEQMMISVCREFKVNYLWLTEGLGPMTNETPENIFDEVQAEYDLDDVDVEILKEYSSMAPEERKALRSYIKAMIAIKKEEA